PAASTADISGSSTLATPVGPTIDGSESATPPWLSPCMLDTVSTRRSGPLAAGSALPRVTSLGPSAEGFVAETCSGSTTAAFRLRALDESPGARSREGVHHRLPTHFSSAAVTSPIAWLV